MKNWSKKEFKTEISYYELLNAKLHKETNPDFAAFQSSESSSYFSDRKISLETFLNLKKMEKENPKTIKTEDKSKMNDEMKKIPYKKFLLKSEKIKYYNFQDIENMNCFNYIYFFPEVFKYYFSQDKFNYINIFDFILNKNSESKKFNSREVLNLFDKKSISHKEFSDLSLNYLFSDDYKDSIERKILKYESDFININELIKFRNLSLGHTLIYTIDKLISGDLLNSDKYLNVVCTGGVANTNNLIKVIRKDIQSLLTVYQDNNKQDYIKVLNTKYDDYSLSFYKGANFMSKLPNLENLMISRVQYFDYGSDYLSYCYI
jgi:actin-related protein